MATVLPLSFIVFDATNRHQRVPDDEAICPRLPCPGLHPLCPQYFVWVPGSNSQQHHIANTFFFFFCFNYWPARFNSRRHGSVSTNKLTSGPGTFCFIQTNWSMWSVLDAPMTVSLQCWCLQQMVLFCEHDLTFSFYVPFAVQTAVPEWAPSHSFPLNFTLLIAPAVIYTQLSSSDFNCSC